MAQTGGGQAPRDAMMGMGARVELQAAQPPHPAALRGVLFSLPPPAEAKGLDAAGSPCRPRPPP